MKLVYPFTFEQWVKANPKAIRWCKKIGKEIDEMIKIEKKNGKQLEINLFN